MLDRIRRRFAHPLGQLPAVLALTAAQQALQIRKAPRTGFRTRKQLRDQPMRPQQLALPSRQTFLHRSCRRITPQSGFRVAHLSTTVVLEQFPNRCIPIHHAVMSSEVEPPCVSIAEKQRVAPLRFATVAMTSSWNRDTPTWEL